MNDDTAALNMPARNHAFVVVVTDPLSRTQIVHGSDWPVIALPVLTRVGFAASLQLIREGNWLRCRRADRIAAKMLR